MNFKKTSMALTLAAAMVAGPVLAHESEDGGIPRLEHVFVIVMENHGYDQIVNNPDEPFVNGLLGGGEVSYAKNYFAVGHPSLNNYLEIVGGSNFGVRSDNAPAWHGLTTCVNTLGGTISADNYAGTATVPVSGDNICPITGSGTDAGTEPIDNWNEVSGTFPFLANIDGVKSIPKASTIGMTIADQLGSNWKSYQESLPNSGADNVTYSNGTVTDLTANTFPNAAQLPNVANLPNTYDSKGNQITPNGYLKLYAAKHNPFVYFKSVQEGGLNNVVSFDGSSGLYADLARGSVPAFSLIAPNQCNDQHGRGNGDSFCSYDNIDNGGQAGLNSGNILQGDATVERLVTSIKASPAWSQGNNAIVIVWDENDYSGAAALDKNGNYPAGAPNNRVLVTVETNYRQSPAVASTQYYNHFSLLKSIEAGLDLPCLNHACDHDVKVMSDLFGR